VNEFPHLTRFGVMKHIDTLRAAGLINTREEGRQRVNSLNAVPIRQIYERWVSRYEEFWADKLLRLKDDFETKRGPQKYGINFKVTDADVLHFSLLLRLLGSAQFVGIGGINLPFPLRSNHDPVETPCQELATPLARSPGPFLITR